MRKYFHTDLKNAKTRFIIGVLTIWAIIGLLFIAYGYEATWQLWGIETLTPAFGDFRLIPGTMETLQRGLDPTIRNPGDPWHRIFNYPAIWYLFRYTGLDQSSTIWFGIALILLFFIGYFATLDEISSADLLPMLLVAFSPASMLLFERGNVDSFIFFLICLIIIQASQSNLRTGAIILLAALLKFFPIASLITFARKGWKVFIIYAISVTGLFAIYLVATRKNTLAAWKTTMRGDDLSYGVSVIGLRYTAEIQHLLDNTFSPQAIANLIQFVPYLLALIIASLAIYFGFKASNLPGSAISSKKLDSFQVGAAIYISTFLLGNNWDYRLAFLLLVVPQLAEWRKTGQSRLALPTLLAIVLSCWYIAIHVYAPDVLAALIFNLDELINWLLFGALTFLLTASLPKWIRLWPRKLLERK